MIFSTLSLIVSLLNFFNLFLHNYDHHRLCAHMRKLVASHDTNGHQVPLSCIFFFNFCDSFSPFTNLLKLKDYTPNFLNHSTVTLARYQRRRRVGAENRPTNARCLPRSHNLWGLSSSQRIAGRPTGVINCYSQVLDPFDSSVLGSSVLVARGDLFFELPHSTRDSPFLPRKEPPSFARTTPT